MIAKLLTSKALPWVAGATVALILALAAALFYLHSQNSQLNERVGDLNQENESLTETARRMSRDYQALQQEIDRRDELVTRTMEEKRTIEGNARETIKKIRKELASDPCAVDLHPDVVGDRLRQGTGDRVQD